ncbi:MAG: histidine phosphatase family protein [Pseudomonadota bacterium]|nr:histidine phosphatase family protein [Pseudomonadota bacterium]
MRTIMVILALSAALSAMAVGAARAEADLWALLRGGGHAALIRHALAPGTGDPAGFRIGDCTTQRNLSDEGRGQARRIGDLFRANGVDTAVLASSQWCRCVETAELMGLGPVIDLPAANSFFADRASQAEQTAGLRRWLASRPLDDVVVVVTHQVNITALTGVYPASGEIVVVRRTGNGAGEVAGRIRTD